MKPPSATNLNPNDLAKATIEKIKPLYTKYKVMINMMIKTNPAAIRNVVTRERLIEALQSGAPPDMGLEVIEQVADFGLAHFNRTVNALLTGCRKGDHSRLADVYAEALGVEASDG